MHCDVGRHLPVSPVVLTVQAPALGLPEGGVPGVLGVQHFSSSVSVLQPCRVNFGDDAYLDVAWVIGTVSWCSYTTTLSRGQASACFTFYIAAVATWWGTRS